MLVLFGMRIRQRMLPYPLPLDSFHKSVACDWCQGSLRPSVSSVMPDDNTKKIGEYRSTSKKENEPQ